MRTSRYTEEQIILALRKQESGQATVAQICREMGFSDATFYKYKRKFGGMNVSEAKRLRELERENSRLKRLLSERTLELDVLQDALKKV